MDNQNTTITEFQLKKLVSGLMGFACGKHKGDLQFLHTMLEDYELPETIIDMVDYSYQNHINSTSKVGDINDTISMALMLMFDKKPETNGLSNIDYIAKDRNITKEEAKEVLDHITTLSEMMRNDGVL